MKTFLTTIILACLTFWGTSSAAPITELERELSDTRKIYTGTCWFDERGLLTFRWASRRWIERCMVFMEADDETTHFLLLVDYEFKPFELRVFGEATRSQEIRWQRDGMWKRPR